MSNCLNAEKIDAKQGLVYFITSDSIGEDKEIGKQLMNSFFQSLIQIENQPEAILLMNSGVKLASENEEIIVHLKELESKGVKILSCGFCLKKYNLLETLSAGIITNMYQAVQFLHQATNVITIR